MLNKNCVNPCPDYFYKDQRGSCNECLPNCISCKDGYSCDKDKMVLVDQAKCGDLCPTGFVNVNGKCLKCTQPNCHTCKPTNLKECLQCTGNLLVWNQYCVNPCPLKTYPTQYKCNGMIKS